MSPRLVLVVLVGCGTSPAKSVDSGIDSSPPDMSNMQSVTFSYTPAWNGVVSVDVIGAFGQSTDWSAPLVSLASSGGTFTGTAMLPPGTYPYLFHVVGDADAGAMAATFDVYAIDPGSANYAPCPSGSPSYAENPLNPCGQLAVPTTAPVFHHITGTVTKSAAPASGYLVLVERDEASSHHFFANRMTTGSDGTYDLEVAAGSWRIQVQHPQYESTPDDALDPDSLGILRRQLSSAVDVSADIAMSTVEMAFGDYATMAPKTTATLPTTFTFGKELPAHLDVYGKGHRIGDPWYASTPVTSAGTGTFDGTFNTKQAVDKVVVLGSRYMWGVEQIHPKDANNVVWTAQSMVFPITWH
jgi:hypothetical protein